MRVRCPKGRETLAATDKMYFSSERTPLFEHNSVYIEKKPITLFYTFNTVVRITVIFKIIGDNKELRSRLYPFQRKNIQIEKQQTRQKNYCINRPRPEHRNFSDIFRIAEQQPYQKRGTEYQPKDGYKKLKKQSGIGR